MQRNGVYVECEFWIVWFIQRLLPCDRTDVVDIAGADHIATK